MRDILNEIWATARRNKLRTALTGFAVAWGIFMIIFLLGAGNGLIHAFSQNSGRFLANSMRAFGGTTTKAYDGYPVGRDISLKDNDVNTTLDVFKDKVVEAGGVVSVSVQTVSLGENYVSAEVEGVTPSHQTIDNLKLAHGRFINRIDLSERRKVLVITDEQAKELAPHHVSQLVGKWVDFGSFSFRIIGVLQTDGTGQQSSMYIPFTTARLIFLPGNEVNSIGFSFKNISSEKESEDFEKAYRDVLGKKHDVAPDDDGAIWVWNRFSQNLKTMQASDIIRTALWIIGIFTLLSGIVGVSNIMLITVKERTHEFGIRKAIGAKPRSILMLIITESVIITTFFGYIGMVLGVAANQYMDATIGNKTVDAGIFKAAMFINPTVGIDVCVGATVVMIVAGTLAGLIPARKAAHVKPIEALRAD